MCLTTVIVPTRNADRDIETDRETEIDGDTETDRETEIDGDTETDRDR